MRFRLVIYFPFLLFPFVAVSQWSPGDSSAFQSAIGHTKQVYYDQAGDQSPIFNGRLYVGYPFTFRAGIPYFLSREFRNENITYEGLAFSDIPLLYDDLSELVITRNQGYWMQLVNERISSFTISSHRFIRIVVDSTNHDLYGTGFYEILYQGRSLLLKKTVKKIREELSSSEGILRFVDESWRYYVRLGNAYFPIRSKKELLEVFSDHKNEVSQFLRKNKLKFKKDPENVIVKVTAYYDQIRK